MSTLRRFFSKIVTFLMNLNSKIDFIILKTDDKQFTLTTKKSLHIIFNVNRHYYLPAYDLVPMQWRLAIVDVSASVIFPCTTVQKKISSGTGSPGWSRKKGRKTVVVVVVVCFIKCLQCFDTVSWVSRRASDL